MQIIKDLAARLSEITKKEVNRFNGRNPDDSGTGCDLKRLQDGRCAMFEEGFFKGIYPSEKEAEHSAKKAGKRLSTSYKFQKSLEQKFQQEIASKDAPIILIQIPEIQSRAIELTGEKLPGEIVDLICEQVYTDLERAFNLDCIDRLDQHINDVLDSRYSEIMIVPANNEDPPDIVESSIAARYVAMGILSVDNPPKRKGDKEVLADFGMDEMRAEKYAQNLSRGSVCAETQLTIDPNFSDSPRM